jgi:hypothetical protein
MTSKISKLRKRARRCKERALVCHILAAAEDQLSISKSLQYQAEALERLSVKYNNLAQSMLTLTKE